MNETLEMIKTRRSIRKYSSKMIPQETLDRIAEAGLYAASGMGRQGTVILQIRDRKLRDEIAEENRRIGGWAEGFDPFYGAPVIFIVLARKSDPTYLYDGSLVMGDIMLAAHALGVGSCWIHRAKEEFESAWGKELLKRLHIEGDFEGIGHCALGYAACDEPQAAPRKENRTFIF